MAAACSAVGDRRFLSPCICTWLLGSGCVGNGNGDGCEFSPDGFHRGDSLLVLHFSFEASISYIAAVSITAASVYMWLLHWSAAARLSKYSARMLLLILLRWQCMYVS